jgi:hypothetical protein
MDSLQKQKQALQSQTTKDNYYISTWKHTKPIPSILENCTCDEFETILELSSKALESLRQSASSLEFQDILNKKIHEVEQKNKQNLEYQKCQFEETKLRETNKLQKEIRDLQAHLEQSSKSYQILNQNFLGLQYSSQENFDKSLNNAIKLVESQHYKLENSYKEQIIKLQTSLEQFTKSAITQNISSNKGKTGEQNFDSLVESFTTWSIEDTSKTPQSCDRYGIIKGCKTLFEIKNYTYNIPKKETDKFKRDMEVHKDCPLGIFISLNTNIVGGKQEFFYTEFSSSNQLLIYIQQFNTYEPSTLFSILDSLIDIATLLHSKCSSVENNTSLQSKVDSIKPILLTQINNIINIIKELTNNNKHIIDSIQKNYSSMKHHLDTLQFTFKTILQTLFESSNDLMILDSSSEGRGQEPPKKKRNRVKKTNENQIVIDATISSS